jgi:hypothetical protein
MGAEWVERGDVELVCAAIVTHCCVQLIKRVCLASFSTASLSATGCAVQAGGDPGQAYAVRCMAGAHGLPGDAWCSSTTMMGGPMSQRVAFLQHVVDGVLPESSHEQQAISAL